MRGFGQKTLNRCPVIGRRAARLEDGRSHVRTMFFPAQSRQGAAAGLAVDARDAQIPASCRSVPLTESSHLREGIRGGHRLWIGFSWFLSEESGIDEVNFWKPGGTTGFNVLSLGAPLLFKLHWPDNYIVGGGFFASYTRLPVSIVWETFGIKNGARTYAEMRTRIEHYRRVESRPREDYEIGNIVLEDPFFLPRERWIPGAGGFLKECGSGKELRPRSA